MVLSFASDWWEVGASFLDQPKAKEIKPRAIPDYFRPSIENFSVWIQNVAQFGLLWDVFVFARMANVIMMNI